MSALSNLFAALNAKFPHKRNLIWAAALALGGYEFLLRPLVAACLPDAPALPSIEGELAAVFAAILGLEGQ